MKVKLTNDTIVRLPKDTVVDVPDAEGQRLIGLGNASEVKAQAAKKK